MLTKYLKLFQRNIGFPLYEIEAIAPPFRVIHIELRVDYLYDKVRGLQFRYVTLKKKKPYASINFIFDIFTFHLHRLSPTFFYHLYAP